MSKKKLDCLKLINYIENTPEFQEFLQPGIKVLIAYSGGQDSTSLLSIFYLLSKKWGFKLGVAYCDHGWKDNKKSVVHALNVLKTYKLPMYLIDCLNHHPLSESEARQWRYTAFETICKKGHYRFLLTGHTLSDKVETVLFNLCRGTGLKGINCLKMKQNLTLLIDPEVKKACSFDFKYQTMVVDHSFASLSSFAFNHLSFNFISSTLDLVAFTKKKVDIKKTKTTELKSNADFFKKKDKKTLPFFKPGFSNFYTSAKTSSSLYSYGQKQRLNLATVYMYDCYLKRKKKYLGLNDDLLSLNLVSTLTFKDDAHLLKKKNLIVSEPKITWITLFQPTCYFLTHRFLISTYFYFCPPLPYVLYPMRQSYVLYPCLQNLFFQNQRLFKKKSLKIPIFGNHTTSFFLFQAKKKQNSTWKFKNRKKNLLCYNCLTCFWFFNFHRKQLFFDVHWFDLSFLNLLNKKTKENSIFLKSKKMFFLKKIQTEKRHIKKKTNRTSFYVNSLNLKEHQTVDFFYIMRPLIRVPRSVLTSFINQLNLITYTDISNQDLTITRNYIRNKILPFFKYVNPQFEKNIYRFSEITKFNFELTSKEKICDSNSLTYFKD